mmetsp:Transcript_48850/g.135526  ORF Transcript_48850/g.135526 Transcript_48850/m.135526 type:complete len:202 (-) Transcript_48850:98-703(-)
MARSTNNSNGSRSTRPGSTSISSSSAHSSWASNSRVARTGSPHEASPRRRRRVHGNKRQLAARHVPDNPTKHVEWDEMECAVGRREAKDEHADLLPHPLGMAQGQPCPCCMVLIAWALRVLQHLEQRFCLSGAGDIVCNSREWPCTTKLGLKTIGSTGHLALTLPPRHDKVIGGDERRSCSRASAARGGRRARGPRHGGGG